MKHLIPVFVCLSGFSGVLFAAPPEPLCANVALSFINAATAGNRQLQSEGCRNTADGLVYEATSTEVQGDGSIWTYEWSAKVADNPAACQPDDTCCLINQKVVPILPLSTIVETYANNGQYRRDLREMQDVCAALLSP